MERTMWVCECCMLLAENGDTSSCRDYYGHTHSRGSIPFTFVLADRTHEVGWFSSYCDSCGVTLEFGAVMHEYTTV